VTPVSYIIGNKCYSPEGVEGASLQTWEIGCLSSGVYVMASHTGTRANARTKSWHPWLSSAGSCAGAQATTGAESRGQ
jgi:hypothetical protein